MPETGEQKRQRVARNLAKLKSAQRPQEEVDAYLESERVVPRIQDEPDYGTADKVGAAAQTFADASTLGLAGLATDAVSSALGPQTFAQDRALRRENKGAFAEAHPKTALGLAVAGALATPTAGLGAAAKGLKGARSAKDAWNAAKVVRGGGAFIKAAPNAGRAARTFAAMGDAGLQSGIAGAVNNLDDTSVEGFEQAAQKGIGAAKMGAGFAGALGGLTGFGTRMLGRVKGMQGLEDTAYKIKDEMKALDDVNYGTAAGEATSTAPIRDILDHAEVAPYAAKVRRVFSAEGKPANDAEVLMETYKMMSQAVRAADKGIEGTADFMADKEASKRILNAMKAQMLNAAETPSIIKGAPRLVEVDQPFNIHPEIARGFPKHTAEMRALQKPKMVEVGPPDITDVEPGIPSLRKAIDTHRVKAGELDAFGSGMDIGKSVGAGKSLSSKEIFTKSKTEFLRSIPDMTPAEAEAALAGVLGRTGEAARITNSPLGAFGLMSSAVRLPMQMYRTGPIIKALEEKIGRKYGDRAMADLIRGTTARVIGAESGKP